MLKLLLRLLGRRVLHKAAARHAQPGGLLDARLGLALLRDRRVPPGAKLLAFGLGVGLTALLIASELPLEGLWSVVFPLFGFLMDTALDGLEALVLPLLLTALLLPFLASRPLVARIRRERRGLLADTDGPVVDVESYAPRAARIASRS
ncbi:MAG TPA: hypothetical protein VFB38_22615 [Chthonomonadaceae bacterium]|nr:hypothetical protein [Chthonomonadaceae bacterium]